MSADRRKELLDAIQSLRSRRTKAVTDYNNSQHKSLNDLLALQVVLADLDNQIQSYQGDLIQIALNSLGESSYRLEQTSQRQRESSERLEQATERLNGDVKELAVSSERLEQATQRLSEDTRGVRESSERQEQITQGLRESSERTVHTTAALVDSSTQLERMTGFLIALTIMLTVATLGLIGEPYVEMKAPSFLYDYYLATVIVAAVAFIAALVRLGKIHRRHHDRHIQ